MNDFLYFKILDNTVLSWLIAAGVILIAFLIRKLISQVIANFIIRFFPKKSNVSFSSDFKQYISTPLGDLIFIIIALGALDKLTLPSFCNIKVYGQITFAHVLQTASRVIAIYASFKLFSGIAKFLFALWRNRADTANNKSLVQLIGVFGGIVNVMLIMFAIMTIANIAFGLNIQGFITSLGIFSAAIALAGKESLENLIASFIIFLDKPFYIGDTVSVNGSQGTIETIGLRSSRLRTADQTILVVPNKRMVDSIVTNFSLRTKWRYTEELQIGLSTKTEDLKILQDAISEILNEDKRVEPKFVYFKETGSNAHVIYLEFFVVVGPTMQEVYDIYSSINEKINEIFKEKNISFAQESSTIEVHTTDQNAIKNGDNDQSPV